MDWKKEEKLMIVMVIIVFFSTTVFGSNECFINLVLSVMSKSCLLDLVALDQDST